MAALAVTVLVCRDGRLSARFSHGFLDSSTFGVDHEVSQEGIGRWSGVSGSRHDPGDMSEGECGHHERACVEGSHPPVCVYPAAADNQSTSATAERKDVLQIAERVSSPTQDILGAAFLGARVLLL